MIYSLNNQRSRLRVVRKSEFVARTQFLLGVSKEQIRKLEEELVRNIIADMMDSNGGYEKPQVLFI